MCPCSNHTAIASPSNRCSLSRSSLRHSTLRHLVSSSTSLWNPSPRLRPRRCHPRKNQTQTRRCRHSGGHRTQLPFGACSLLPHSRRRRRLGLGFQHSRALVARCGVTIFVHLSSMTWSIVRNTMTTNCSHQNPLSPPKASSESRVSA